MSVGGNQELDAMCHNCNGSFKYVPDQPGTDQQPEYCVFCGSDNVTFTV